MSEYDYKTGVSDANKGLQPSPPDPAKTAEQNNSYSNGYQQEQKRLEEQRRQGGL